MLGKNKLLTEGLEAKALVLDKTVYAQGVQTNRVNACNYRLLVRFQDGSETEISRRVFHTELAGAAVGSLIPVRYDPDDRSKIEIDGAAMKAAQEAEANEWRERSLERGKAALEGRDPASQASQMRDTVERANETVTGISATTTDLSETMAAIQRAKASGDSAEVERLKAEFARRSKERNS
jgi:hypothetical protein